MVVAGQDAWLREVLLRNKPQEMLDAGTRGTVPLLMMPSGDALEESLDIMDWALGRHDPRGWLVQRDQPELVARLDANDGPFKLALDQYKYPDRFADVPAVELGAARERALAYLSALDELLVGQRYLGGEDPGFFDVAIFPFVRQFAAVDPPWFERSSCQRVVTWRSVMVEHPLFTTVMGKHVAWKQGDVPICLLDSLVSPRGRTARPST